MKTPFLACTPKKGQAALRLRERTESEAWRLEFGKCSSTGWFPEESPGFLGGRSLQAFFEGGVSVSVSHVPVGSESCQGA